MKAETNTSEVDNKERIEWGICLISLFPPTAATIRGRFFACDVKRYLITSFVSFFSRFCRFSEWLEATGNIFFVKIYHFHIQAICSN